MAIRGFTGNDSLSPKPSRLPVDVRPALPPRDLHKGDLMPDVGVNTPGSGNDTLFPTRPVTDPPLPGETPPGDTNPGGTLDPPIVRPPLDPPGGTGDPPARPPFQPPTTEPPPVIHTAPPPQAQQLAAPPQKLGPLGALEKRFDGTAANLEGERLLKQLGLHPGTVDKHLTANTVVAVKQFQKSVGLKPTGALDAHTLKAMRKAARLKHKGVQARGQHSKAIKATERRLKHLGYKVGKVDGTFDKKTAEAVREFKKDEGMKVRRGILGAHGRKLLAEEAKNN